MMIAAFKRQSHTNDTLSRVRFEDLIMWLIFDSAILSYEVFFCEEDGNFLPQLECPDFPSAG